jgi:Leucine-rich repeat (LRR) protein
MSILDEYDSNVTSINITSNIYGPLDFSRFIRLNKLNCKYCYITSLDNLPNSLIELNCSENEITSLDNLPNKLTELDCSSNKISSLDNLVPKGTEAFSLKKTFLIH